MKKQNVFNSGTTKSGSENQLELIPIQKSPIGEETYQTVDARNLHDFLESKQEFAHWIKNRIEKYGFVEGESYLINLSNRSDGKAGKPRKDYILTLDMAKHLAMVENNEKGMLIRQYFIEVEKRAKAFLRETIKMELVAQQYELSPRRGLEPPHGTAWEQVQIDGSDVKIDVAVLNDGSRWWFFRKYLMAKDWLTSNVDIDSFLTLIHYQDYTQFKVIGKGHNSIFVREDALAQFNFQLTSFHFECGVDMLEQLDVLMSLQDDEARVKLYGYWKKNMGLVKTGRI